MQITRELLEGRLRECQADIVKAQGAVAHAVAEHDRALGRLQETEAWSKILNVPAEEGSDNGTAK